MLLFDEHTVETKSFSGNMWPQLKAVFPEQNRIERSSINSWDDKNLVAAIEETGKKKVILTGLWTETCIALPAGERKAGERKNENAKYCRQGGCDYRSQQRHR
jgi:hypothetical protein